MIESVAKLLSPHDPADLEQAIRRRERLHLHTDQPEAISTLLPWTTVNRLVTPEALSSGRVVFVRENRSLPLEMTTVLPLGASDRTMRVNSVHSLCRQGVSLYIGRVDRLVPEIDLLGSLLERHLRTRIHINAYISFSRDSAFRPHWDDHDVLVLQVSGRKRWWSFGQPFRYPSKAAAFANPGPVNLDEPAGEWVMEPGDILFLPRGEVHRAKVSGDNSVHLTIGMTPPRGTDVLHWLATRGIKEECLRRDVSPCSTPEELERQASELKTELHRLVDTLDLQVFLADEDRRCAFTPALNLNLGGELTPSLLVRPTPRRRLPLPPADAGVVELEVGDKRFTLSPLERAVLAVLLADEARSVAELCDAVPQAGVQAAIDSLAQKGLVTIVGSG